MPRIPHHPRCTAWADARAYTLVELMMVLAIIGLCAGIVVPRYGRSLTRYRADAAARRVASDFALARATARTTSTSQSIDFSAPTNGYTVSGLIGLDRTTSAYRVDLTQPPFQTTLSSNLRLVSNNAAVTKVNFDRYGTPDASGTITVASGDVQKTITLDPNTARATVN